MFKQESLMLLKKSNKKIVESAEGNEDLLDNLTDEEIEALAAEIENDETEEEDAPEIEEGVTEADVDGTAGMDAKFKTNRLSIAMHKLASMDAAQVDFFLKSLDQVGHEADMVPDVSGKNQASIAMKGKPDSISTMNESLKTALKEDLASIFGDNKELTEDFKEKMATLFEAAVSFRATEMRAELEEEYNERLEEEVESLTDTLVAKVDEYISYVAEQFIEKNEVAIEKSLTNEIAEDFMKDFKDLLLKHNIDIPSDKVDVAESLADKVEELEEALNTVLEDNMMLTEFKKNTERENLVSEFTTGMTLSQTEKFKQLIESIDYDEDDESFKKKLEIVKSSHFKDVKGVKSPSTNIITEESSYTRDELAEESKEEVPLPTDPEMRANYLALKRALKR